jgi:hypothetical protein
MWIILLPACEWGDPIHVDNLSHPLVSVFLLPKWYRKKQSISIYSGENNCRILFTKILSYSNVSQTEIKFYIISKIDQSERKTNALI